MSIYAENIFRNLHDFDFASLFIRDLHWHPPVNKRRVLIDRKHSRREIARYANVPILEIYANDGVFPNFETRGILRKELFSLFPRCLLIFVDGRRTGSIWQWTKSVGTNVYQHEYLYTQGQPADVLLDKLHTMLTDLLPTDQTRRESYRTDNLCRAFADMRRLLAENIEGVLLEQDRDVCASILLNRLIFLYFLQQRGALGNGNVAYLEDALKKSQNGYYHDFLLPLFSQKLVGSLEICGADVCAYRGEMVAQNHSLFHSHVLEQRAIRIPDRAFDQLFSFFSRYTWQLFDIPCVDKEDEAVTPEKLGRIFEMQFNQTSGAGFSATPPEIIEYLCKQTIYRAIVEDLHLQTSSSWPADTLQTIFGDKTLCQRLLFDVLPSLTILDPACGSGTFLVAALHTLTLIYNEALQSLSAHNDDSLSRWPFDPRSHGDRAYHIKNMILTTNLYGIDIQEDAIETTRLRLSLSLLASLPDTREMGLPAGRELHLSRGDFLIRTGTDEVTERPLAFVRESVGSHSIDKGGFSVILTQPPWEEIKASSDIYPNYRYQSPATSGKTRATRISLAKLFLEQSYYVLREGGYCGIILPHEICHEEGSRRLRELLLNRTSITGIFGLENRKKIFEGLGPHFQYDLLSFRKGSFTEIFPVAFQRQNIEELDSFPQENAVHMSAAFLRLFSPDSLVIAEMQSQKDIHICEKMLKFSLLREKQAAWNATFAQGISRHAQGRSEQTHRDLDAPLLIEGKMIHQFTYTSAPSGQRVQKHSNTPLQRRSRRQLAGYRGYRLGIRNVAPGAAARTILAAILPPDVLAGGTIHLLSNALEADILLFLTAIFNSFVADFYMRFRVHIYVACSHLSLLPVPRFTRQDEYFFAIVERAARLVCTTRAFKELWEAALHKPWTLKVATATQGECNRLHAELDGLIAHVYDINEEEYAYILRSFPLVADPVKIAAQNAYRDVERGILL